MRIISGIYKNRKIMTPKGMDTRPTSDALRETLFNICQNYIEEAKFLDLFAGSGAMGIEALSRGAAFVTFIDMKKESIHCIKENLKLLKIESNVEVLLGDVFLQLSKLMKQKKSYDIIYVDPPYGKEKLEGNHAILYSHLVLKMVDESNLLSPKGILFIEDSPSQKIELNNLTLVNSRRAGKATLQEWKKN